MTRPARRLPNGTALVLALGLAMAAAGQAGAGPAEDYIAARDKAVAALVAAEKAGTSPEVLEKRDAADRKALEQKMRALLGPLRLKGFTATFSPATLLEGNIDSGGPDGLLFAQEDSGTYLLVSPEPVFANWLAARAKGEGAAQALSRGIAAATASDDFYTLAIGTEAAFSRYMDLPVTAAEGETVRAAIGLFSQDLPANTLPESVVVTRVANGRVAVGTSAVELGITALPACDKAWKAADAKTQALRTAAEKSKNQDDPRWAQANSAEVDASLAFRACFAKEAAGKPFLAAAVKRAEALLANARSN
jgi:hypothetical protein